MSELWSATNKPLIIGEHTPYGPASDAEMVEMEVILRQLQDEVDEGTLTTEFRNLLVDHCLAFSSCFGSIHVDPRVLLEYLRRAWDMNDGRDLRQLLEWTECDRTKAQEHSDEQRKESL
jgi:hypothetical protein